MRARFERATDQAGRMRTAADAGVQAPRVAVLLAVALVAGCGGRAAVPTKDNGCRAVAQAAERWVAAAPAAGREEALRFAVEVIDLCQRPGLGPVARTCVAGAADAAAASACPGLGLVHRATLAPLFAQPSPHGGGDDGDDDDGSDE